MGKKRILFITNKYPNEIDPNGLVFVQQLVWSIADMGVECTVICPLAINLDVKLCRVRYKRTEITDNNHHVKVLFPRYFGIGQSYRVLYLHPAIITTYFFTQAIIQTIKRENITPNVAYGHFVTPAGISAARVGRLLKIPSFLAHGESTTWSIDNIGLKRAKDELRTLSGVIAVSTRNKELLEGLGVVRPEIIKVIPNGFRTERFYPRDRLLSRRKFGWDSQQFIVGFVGSFDERKGVLRLQQAVEQIKKEEVLFACAGKGKLIPTGKRCIFAKPVDNSELPFFYSAIDIFVLPTLNEGCCNAIVEAMACGCPIISSDRSFNYDICDESNSILVEPDDIMSIRNAIELLYYDKEKRRLLSRGSIEKAKELSLKQRAVNILELINRSIDCEIE